MALHQQRSFEPLRIHSGVSSPQSDIRFTFRVAIFFAVFILVAVTIYDRDRTMPICYFYYGVISLSRYESRSPGNFSSKRGVHAALATPGQNLTNSRDHELFRIHESRVPTI